MFFANTASLQIFHVIARLIPIHKLWLNPTAFDLNIFYSSQDMILPPPPSQNTTLFAHPFTKYNPFCTSLHKIQPFLHILSQNTTLFAHPSTEYNPFCTYLKNTTFFYIPSQNATLLHILHKILFFQHPLHKIQPLGTSLHSASKALRRAHTFTIPTTSLRIPSECKWNVP